MYNKFRVCGVQHVKYYQKGTHMLPKINCTKTMRTNTHLVCQQIARKMRLYMTRLKAEDTTAA